MIGFVVASSLMLLCVLLGLWWSLWRVTPSERQIDLSANKTIFKEREIEIEALYAKKEISATEKEQFHAENARRLLAEAASDNDDRAGKSVSNTWLVLIMAVIFPLCAGALYVHLGSYPQMKQWQALSAGNSSLSETNMRDAMLMLRTRLHQDPDDVDGWYMLGRSYMSLDRPQEAMQAFATAHRIVRKEVEYIVAYAQTLRMVDAENGLPEVDRLLAEALLLNPEHEGARILTAYRAMESGKYEAAIAGFSWLRERRAGDSQAMAMLDGLIAQAKAEQNKGLNERTPSTTPNAVVTSPIERLEASVSKDVMAVASDDANHAVAQHIEVTVNITEELRAKLPKAGKVFVFAKAENGPPLPVAVAILDPSTLPATVLLSDANAMNPAIKLSDHQRVKLHARVSQTGKVEPKSGDLEGESPPFEWRAASKQQLTIDRSIK